MGSVCFPRIPATLFWISMIVSACSSCRRSCMTSRSSRLTRGSTGFGFGPRFLDRRLASAPASRCRRQADSNDEYSPSRRSRAPTSPGAFPLPVQRQSAERHHSRHRVIGANHTGPGQLIMEEALR